MQLVGLDDYVKPANLKRYPNNLDLAMSDYVLPTSMPSCLNSGQGDIIAQITPFYSIFYHQAKDRGKLGDFDMDLIWSVVGLDADRYNTDENYKKVINELSQKREFNKIPNNVTNYFNNLKTSTSSNYFAFQTGGVFYDKFGNTIFVVWDVKAHPNIIATSLFKENVHGYKNKDVNGFKHIPISIPYNLPLIEAINYAFFGDEVSAIINNDDFIDKRKCPLPIVIHFETGDKKDALPELWDVIIQTAILAANLIPGVGTAVSLGLGGLYQLAKAIDTNQEVDVNAIYNLTQAIGVGDNRYIEQGISAYNAVKRHDTTTLTRIAGSTIYDTTGWDANAEANNVKALMSNFTGNNIQAKGQFNSLQQTLQGYRDAKTVNRAFTETNPYLQDIKKGIETSSKYSGDIQGTGLTFDTSTNSLASPDLWRMYTMAVSRDSSKKTAGIDVLPKKTAGFNVISNLLMQPTFQNPVMHRALLNAQGGLPVPQMAFDYLILLGTEELMKNSKTKTISLPVGIPSDMQTCIKKELQTRGYKIITTADIFGKTSTPNTNLPSVIKLKKTNYYMR